MNDLTAFLRARLDDDEQTARAVGFDRIEVVDYLWDSKHLLLQGEGGSKATSELPPNLADHIARHDPARVLAEVDAKRRILVEHRQDSLPNGIDLDECATCGGANETWPCPTLRLMALPYASHPDYKDAWRP